MVREEHREMAGAVVTLPQARRDEMRTENDAQLRLLYQIRCWVRQEIRFREKLRDEWFRKEGK